MRNPIWKVDHKKRYEKLESLPAYGPMYISVTGTDEKYFSEGFVVRFFKTDDTDWVANFKPGWTDCDAIFDFPDSDKIIVIAGGQGYVMNPDSEKPLETFAMTIDNVFKTNDNKIVLTDGFHVRLIGSNGELWCSPRISWDGIKELELNDKLLTGLVFNPTRDQDDWTPFTLDIGTRKIIGGSYSEYLPHNDGPIQKKKWWKLW